MELLKNRDRHLDDAHARTAAPARAVTDLLGGQIEVMFLPIHVALQHVKAGKLKALAISSDKPQPAAARRAAAARAQAGRLNVDMWYGVLAPKGTPQPFIERLNRELKEILALPDGRRRPSRRRA